MTLITKNLVQQLIKNNPDHYKNFKNKIHQLKKIKKDQFQLKDEIEKQINRRIENKLNSESKEYLIKIGEELDELINLEEQVRFEIVMDKVSLNIPLNEEETQKVGQAIKDLFGSDESQNSENNGYAKLFK